MPYKDPLKAKTYSQRPDVKERRRLRDKERYKRDDVKSQKREYNKQYYSDVVKKDIEFRQNLLSIFSCIVCEESEPCAIDWHHVNSSTKEFNVRDVTRNHDSWWNEVLKCVPLCANCHRKLHNNKLCLLPVNL
jgi:hypothetical protein